MATAELFELLPSCGVFAMNSAALKDTVKRDALKGVSKKYGS